MIAEPTILQETTDWVALEKPPGLVVHDVPGEKHAGATLVDWLRAHLPATAANFPGDDPRPGIVHRLDADTSGVILVAKTPAALQALQDQFRGRTTQKTYQALVLGTITRPGVFVGHIGRSGADTEHRVKRLQFSWDKHQAKPAETRYRPLRHLADAAGNRYTLVELQPKTGRTHQLRVQLLDAGWPILGDQTYGTKESRAASQQLGLKRQFLHAVALVFSDPSTAAAVEASSPLAHDLQQALGRLTPVRDTAGTV